MKQPKARVKKKPTLGARVGELEERMARVEAEIRILATLPGRMQELTAQMGELSITVRSQAETVASNLSRLEADVIDSRETILRAIGALRPCAETMGRAAGLTDTGRG